MPRLHFGLVFSSRERYIDAPPLLSQCDKCGRDARGIVRWGTRCSLAILRAILSYNTLWTNMLR